MLSDSMPRTTRLTSAAANVPSSTPRATAWRKTSLVWWRRMTISS
jgi:hypothetical protein